MCSKVMSLVVSCACIYYDKKGLFGVLPLEKSPVSEFTARLLSLMAKNGVYYARRKKFGSILLMGQGKGLWKFY